MLAINAPKKIGEKPEGRVRKRRPISLHFDKSILQFYFDAIIMILEKRVSQNLATTLGRVYRKHLATGVGEMEFLFKWRGCM